MAGVLLIACARRERRSWLEECEDIRILLEGRVHGMSGAGARIEPVLSIPALEAQSVREMEQCERCPKVPFGFANDEWKAFASRIKPGDLVVFFRNSDAQWSSLGGAEGYALVRDSKLEDVFLTSMS
jgi:hypothetical protein